MNSAKVRQTSLIASLFAVFLSPILAPGASAEDPPITLVVHGGAGTILKKEMSPELEADYKETLSQGLLVGYKILADGGSSLDAVEATIRVYEDSPLFNAGKGAVFTADGRNELDASIMDGATLEAGAVAAVTRIKNPISAARAVMESTPHVLLAGDAADGFADAQGLEMVESSYFFTQRRWDALQKVKKRESSESVTREGFGFGTVGALALDRSGRLAAGTSTGGLTNKRHGRVGDSPIIGAGTYADDDCAVSGTGHGEFFIRYAVAYDVCARVKYQGVPIREAAETVILEKLQRVGGEAGAIALDRDGNFAMPFNTEGMYRGYIRGDGKPVVAIYNEEGE